ncbi:hypothetical protein F5X68DRAFT_16790 [Plectosphaerella plurivora]|uniref:Uncharacterized protein n=1 Tax=Plectosphaerella plurivora TaxID=936078 RepID=A0A9P8V9X7_9PEZI|nr:hypothetical protein F5X68DRAFT_16790 [Plectosphaerella plurivora]
MRASIRTSLAPSPAASTHPPPVLDCCQARRTAGDQWSLTHPVATLPVERGGRQPPGSERPRREKALACRGDGCWSRWCSMAPNAILSTAGVTGKPWTASTGLGNVHHMALSLILERQRPLATPARISRPALSLCSSLLRSAPTRRAADGNFFGHPSPPTPPRSWSDGPLVLAQSSVFNTTLSRAVRRSSFSGLSPFGPCRICQAKCPGPAYYACPASHRLSRPRASRLPVRPPPRPPSLPLHLQWQQYSGLPAGTSVQ